MCTCIRYVHEEERNERNEQIYIPQAAFGGVNERVDGSAIAFLFSGESGNDSSGCFPDWIDSVLQDPFQVYSTPNM